MSKIAFADLICEWDALLAAVDSEEGALTLASVASHREELRRQLAEVRALKALQDNAHGIRQKATQDLGEKIAQGKETVARLRGVVMADLGPKNERLRQFGVAPVRSRRRRGAGPAPAEAEPTDV